MPAISTAIGLGLAGASAASNAIGKHKAAGAQKAGAQQALALEQESQKKALAAQQPYSDLGTQSVNNLKNLTATPGQGLLAGFNEQFQAPTLEQAEQNPGYQFALQQGTKALDRSAAAKGNLFTGTQGEALQEFGQNLAQQNYGDVYNRAMHEYLNRFNIFNTNQNNEYSRLMGTENIGQNAANNISNVNMAGGEQQAQQINNAAAARASGYAGVGNAISQGLGYGANVAMQWPQLSSGAQPAPAPSAGNPFTSDWMYQLPMTTT